LSGVSELEDKRVEGEIIQDFVPSKATATEHRGNPSTYIIILVSFCDWL